MVYSYGGDACTLTIAKRTPVNQLGNCTRCTRTRRWRDCGMFRTPAYWWNVNVAVLLTHSSGTHNLFHLFINFRLWVLWTSATHQFNARTLPLGNKWKCRWWCNNLTYIFLFYSYFSAVDNDMKNVFSFSLFHECCHGDFMVREHEFNTENSMVTLMSARCLNIYC